MGPEITAQQTRTISGIQHIGGVGGEPWQPQWVKRVPPPPPPNPRLLPPKGRTRLPTACQGSSKGSCSWSPQVRTCTRPARHCFDVPGESPVKRLSGNWGMQASKSPPGGTSSHGNRHTKTVRGPRAHRPPATTTATAPAAATHPPSWRPCQGLAPPPTGPGTGHI